VATSICLGKREESGSHGPRHASREARMVVAPRAIVRTEPVASGMPGHRFVSSARQFTISQALMQEASGG